MVTTFNAHTFGMFFGSVYRGEHFGSCWNCIWFFMSILHAVLVSLAIYLPAKYVLAYDIKDIIKTHGIQRIERAMAASNDFRIILFVACLIGLIALLI